MEFPLLEADGGLLPDQATGSTLLWGSDAHIPEQVGARVSVFRMNAPTLDEIRRAAAGEGGRSVVVRRRDSKRAAYEP
jgi:hypothetical protein